jgi:hypothetical protein
MRAEKRTQELIIKAVEQLTMSNGFRDVASLAGWQLMICSFDSSGRSDKREDRFKIGQCYDHYIFSAIFIGKNGRFP